MRQKTHESIEKTRKKKRIFIGNADPINPYFNKDMTGLEKSFQSILKMGHQLVGHKWNYTPGIYENWTEKRKNDENDKLLKHVREEQDKKKIDIFLTMTDVRFMHPKTIEKIKNLGIVTVNLAPDDFIPFEMFEKLYKDIAIVFDYNWTGQMISINYYKKIGARYIYSPIGADPQIFKPYDCKKIYDVTFNGRDMCYRGKIIKMLIEKNIDVQVWGNYWDTGLFQSMKRKTGYTCKFLVDYGNSIKFQEVMSLVSDLIRYDFSWYVKYSHKVKKIFYPFLPLEEMIKIFSKSKICLNFSGYWGSYQNNINKSTKVLRGRDIEVPMCGAFYLTEYSDEIASLYKIGKEIETFKTISELIDKVTYYLNNPSEMEAVRKAGRKKALDEFTWEKVFEKIFDKINIS